MPIPHAGGTYPPKPLTPILGGILALESDWQPSLGQSLKDALVYNSDEEKLDFGCITAHGNFYFNSENKTFDFSPGGKPATEFLFRLISMLQVNGTVPMIDIQAYAQWLND